MTVLCASDPDAMLGVRPAFGLEPDVAAGPAANASAAVALVCRLASVEALNLADAGCREPLRRMLVERLSPKVSGR